MIKYDNLVCLTYLNVAGTNYSTYNGIFNKILNHDWFFVHLFVKVSVHDLVCDIQWSTF